MNDWIATATEYRNRAFKVREHAAPITDPELAKHILNLAETYEDLAKHCEMAAMRDAAVRTVKLRVIDPYTEVPAASGQKPDSASRPCLRERSSPYTNDAAQEPTPDLCRRGENSVLNPPTFAASMVSGENSICDFERS